MTREWIRGTDAPTELDLTKAKIFAAGPRNALVVLDEKAFTILIGKTKQRRLDEYDREHTLQSRKEIVIAKPTKPPEPSPQAPVENVEASSSANKSPIDIVSNQEQVIDVVEVPLEQTTEQILDAVQEQSDPSDPVDVVEQPPDSIEALQEEWCPSSDDWFLAQLIFINPAKHFAIALIQGRYRVFVTSRVTKSRTGHFLCLPIGSNILVRLYRNENDKRPDSFVALEALIEGDIAEVDAHTTGVVQFWSEEKATFGSVKFLKCEDSVLAMTASRFEPIILNKGEFVSFDLVQSDKKNMAVGLNVRPLHVEEEV